MGEGAVVVCLSFCRQDVANGFKQSVVVEPVHPFQGGKFDRILCLPRCPAMDRLSVLEC